MSILDDFFGQQRACRVCGCTATRACVSKRHGACLWVEWDLCSHCAMKRVRQRAILVVAAVAVVVLMVALALYVRARHG